MNLWQDVLTNSIKNNPRPTSKWPHYFPIYEKHFKEWRNKSLVFWDIGVDRGGSVQFWQRFFGPHARIVGLDINPECSKFSEPGIDIRIGDQSDTAFLESVIDEFGAPDIVLDDGSHVMSDVVNTFEFLYPYLPKNGIYMVEDMHTSYWPHYGGGIKEPNSFINISKNCIDKLNAYHTGSGLQGSPVNAAGVREETIEPDYITDNTACISFYDSVVVYEKGQMFRRVSTEF